MSAEVQPKVDNFPALAEMGIARFHEISHYTLRQDGEEKDILRVIYKRAKGSLLPFSRKYRFGRSLKTVLVDGGASRLESTYEISPFLLKAIAELDSLLSENKKEVAAVSQSDLAGDVLSDLDELSRMIAKGDTAEALNAKVDNIRKHVQAL